MGEKKWERLGALTGVVMAVIVAARTLITPTVPIADWIGAADPLSSQVWFDEHRSVWLLTVWLTGLIVVAGTWFHGGLRAYLTRQGASRLAGIGYAGWIITATIALVRHTILAVPALSPIPDEATAALFTLGPLLLGMVWFGAFITATAVAIAGARFKALPWWFNFLTAVEAVILGCGTLQLVFVGGGYFSMSGDFRWIVLWSYVAWTAIGGLVLYSRLGRED